MKTFAAVVSLVALILFGCTEKKTENAIAKKMNTSLTDSITFKSGYESINGLQMYYEIYGEGNPLVLIHGGGSTIQTSFEKIIPLLSKNRQLIAVELQAHGRTSDRNAASSFEKDADDVAALLKTFAITKADFFGFSNGATTTLQIAIRHPELVNKMILGSVLYNRNGVSPAFWDFMKNASLANMPQPLQEAYLKLNADDTAGLQTMHDRDAKRMVDFENIPEVQIQSIIAPALIINGDKDVILPEHALALHKLLSNSQLAIIPGTHGEYMGEVTTITPDFKESDLVIVPLIEKFLK